MATDFSSLEISTQDSQEIVLYAFRYGLTYYRYTSADRDITVTEPINGQQVEVTYKAAGYSDDGVMVGSSQTNDFTVHGPYDGDVAKLYRNTPPVETVWLTVRRKQPDSDDVPIFFKGIVYNAKPTSSVATDIICRPLAATFKRTGLRLCWTKECPHFLYDQDCTVDPANFRTPAVIQSMTSTEVIITVDPGREANYFQGGVIEWQTTVEGTLDRRMIQSSSGTDMVIFGQTDGLEVGMNINLYPGCNRTYQHCKDKFNNLPNSGGFEFMPGKTPFGTQIF
jgi:uncharacterized phage protein (TIGR02218 family)